MPSPPTPKAGVSASWRPPQVDVTALPILLVGIVSQLVDRLGTPVLIAIVAQIFMSPTPVPASPGSAIYWLLVIAILLASLGFFAAQYYLVSRRDRRLARRAQLMAQAWLAARALESVHPSVGSLLGARCHALLKAQICAVTIVFALLILLFFDAVFSAAYGAALLAFVGTMCVLRWRQALRQGARLPAPPAEAREIPEEKLSPHQRLRQEKIDRAIMSTVVVALLCIELQSASSGVSLVIFAMILAKLNTIVRRLVSCLRTIVYGEIMLARLFPDSPDPSPRRKSGSSFGLGSEAEFRLSPE
jgi:hypothetical protein